MYQFLGTEVIRKRVQTDIDPNWQITAYGVDNLYPQLMDELYKRSPLTKAAIQVLTEFIGGQGWEGKGDEQVNRFGQTWNDLLRIAANELSTFSGFAFHINFDGMGQPIEIQELPFQYVRLGLKNEGGITNYCMVSSNWEGDAAKYVNYVGVNPKRFELYNPATAALNAFQKKGGQVLYYTPRMFSYPLASFDAIRDCVQTDSEIQTFMLAGTQNGFMGTTLFKIPGGFDSDEDRRRVTEKVKQMQGASNANSIFIAETPEDYTTNLIEPIPAPNNDKLFDSTWMRVRDMILQNYALPGPLMGVSPEGAVFTQGEIRDSYIYVNARTKNKRRLLEGIFAPLAKQAGVNLGKIEEQEFEIPGLNMPVLNGDPNQMKPDQSKEDPKPEEETNTDAKMRKIYG